MKLLAAGLSGASIAVVVFLAAATATVPDSWMLPLRETSTDNAYVQGDVTPIAPKVSGYIVEVAVRDHQLVKPGTYWSESKTATIAHGKTKPWPASRHVARC